jgi:hypothetical protein
VTLVTTAGAWRPVGNGDRADVRAEREADDQNRVAETAYPDAEGEVDYVHVENVPRRTKTCPADR